MRHTAWNELHVIDGAGVVPFRLLPICRYVLCIRFFGRSRLNVTKLISGSITLDRARLLVVDGSSDFADAVAGAPPSGRYGSPSS